MKKLIAFIYVVSSLVPPLNAQELKYNFDSQGNTYIKTTFLLQSWSRWNNNNPASQLNGHNIDQIWDMGLRRVRSQIMIKPNAKTFIYAQIGNNNLSFNTTRKQGIFFHDVTGEINFIENKFTLGTGLTGWGGYLRYSAPAAASILGIDAPLFQQATNDVNDQFLRKFSFFAKGKLGKLDYRFAVSKPMTINNATASVPGLSTSSNFTPRYSNAQLHGYAYWSFLDQENNLTPYLPGTYLGSKNILNLGVGFLHQKNAMWNLNEEKSDTLFHRLSLIGIDLFFEKNINAEKKNTLSIYSAWSFQDFGPNYFRSIGVMNPMNGSSVSNTIGYGNAQPLIGTGSTQFFQLAYLFKHNLLHNWGTLQVFYNGQYNQFEAFKDDCATHEAGVNWLIQNNHTKISLAIQNRPLFDQGNEIQKPQVNGRRNCYMMQFQFFI